MTWQQGDFVPARATMALDMRDLYGPEVDAACGGAEPDVDLWEAGVAVPTAEQVALLAALTDFPVAWFFKPLKVGPQSGPVFVCYRGRGKKDSHVRMPDVITEDMVLLHEGQPRKVAKSKLTAARRRQVEKATAGQGGLF